MQITLKAARVNSGYTQKKAATLLDVAVDTLQCYERGKTFPDVPMIRKIENLYGVSYSDIYFFEA